MKQISHRHNIVINLLIVLILILPINGAVVDPAKELEQIRAYSRVYEFDYVTWTVSAMVRKLVQSTFKVDHYLPHQEKRELVLEYLDLRNEVSTLQAELANLLSDPNQENREQRESSLRAELNQKDTLRIELAPFVEQVLQDQLNSALVDLDLAFGGQLFPPVLYKSEPDSYALIVSPRDEIRQAANMMLVRGLTLDQIISLEEDIENNLDLSALIVGIGGVGLYPSMIIETGNLDWLIHVVSHEWTHNYLTLRPLGMFYGTSPEITTINETIADLSADAIQSKTFELYYPEHLPSEPELPSGEDSPPQESIVETEPAPEEVFDFRAEMHITRLEVDSLLAEGKIAEAEYYMESRRIIFWENGYLIRRLNQAYFAFHGSYAAEPGGAAGEEGVDLGAELRKLKQQTPSYREFMRLVAWKWRLDQFEALFEFPQPD
ncbi:MAG TPA: hypothetical protein ENF22_02120 [Chloroflexi bacterium]|nr:hypothetical protein [Chloroflexota bacterium]